MSHSCKQVVVLGQDVWSRARGACQLGPEHPVDIVGRRILHYAAPVCTIFNRAIFTVALAKRVLILLLLAPAANVFVEKRC